MAIFRDIWNLLVTGDTSDAEGKVKRLAKTAEETGATVETTFRGRMSASLGNFAEKIPGVSGLMEKFGVTSQQAGAVLGTAVATGAALAGEKVAEFAKHAVDEFEKQSQEVLHFKEVTGLAADESSRFVAVAGDYAVSAEDLSAAIGKMDKAAGATPEKLRALGIEIAKTASGGYDAQQTFLNVVRAFNSTDDASKKAQIGAAAFGRGWQSVVKLLDVGADQIQTSFGKVKDFQIFSDADLKKSEDYRHAMDDLNDAVKGFEREVGQALVPALAKGAKELTHMIEEADKLGKVAGGVFHAVGSDAGDFFKVLTNPGGLALDRVKDLGGAISDFFGGGDDGKKLAKGFDNVANSSDKTTISILRDAAALATHQEALDKATDSAKIYMENNQGLRDALDKQRDAFDKATKATQDFRQAQNDLRNDQLGLQGAIYSSQDAIDTYRAKTIDGTSSIRDQEKANIDVQKSFDDVAQKAIDAAAQQAALHGATLTANGAIGAQLDALRKVADALGPEDGKVRAELDLYMLALFNIPGQIVTNVDLTGTGLEVLGRAISGSRREGSGAQGYSTPAEVVGAVKAYESSNGTSWRTGPQ